VHAWKQLLTKGNYARKISSYELASNVGNLHEIAWSCMPLTIIKHINRAPHYFFAAAPLPEVWESCVRQMQSKTLDIAKTWL
jgi:hypothetical protein